MRRFAVSICLAGAFAPVAAHADVLEIGTAGATWISGGPTVPEEISPAAPLAEVGDLTIPEEAVASPAASSAALPARYEAAVHQLAARFDLSPALIEALVWQESRWREGAVSPVGARGLAQLMPGTAREMGVNPDDPLANLEGGARYLRQQLDRFDGDVEKALAAYNAGPGRVEKAGGIPRIRETQVYVAAVMGRLAGHTRSDD